MFGGLGTPFSQPNIEGIVTGEKPNDRRPSAADQVQNRVDSTIFPIETQPGVECFDSPGTVVAFEVDHREIGTVFGIQGVGSNGNLAVLDAFGVLPTNTCNAESVIGKGCRCGTSIVDRAFREYAQVFFENRDGL